MSNGADNTAAPGEFAAGSFSNEAGTRDYKLSVPSRYQGQALPLLVMLHGCTQNPDDFAAGTRMNAVADEQDCFVLYPAQSPAANSSLCWNWFHAADQQRDRGEAAIIAGLTRKIMESYGIDARRVFVAGLSAGGAMAVILGATYSDIYAAVGSHSGMPYRAAQNLITALSAMRRGAEDYTLKNLEHLRTIVFHGDRDKRVHPRNSEQILVQMLGAEAPRTAGELLSVQSLQTNGRSYERRVYRDVQGHSLAEHWLVHGTAHAWSGGSLTGSHADAKGPDASREMLRFFLRGPETAEPSRIAHLPKQIVRGALRALKLLPSRES